jgi:hypothetical protein
LHGQGIDANGDTGSWSEAGELWEKAGRAALDGGDYAATLSHAGLARDCYTRHGDLRAVFMVHGLLYGLRGDTVAAQLSVAALDDMRASEDPQDICGVRLPEAFIAVARRKPEEALRCARSVLSFADTLGMTQDVMQWAWPLAARLAAPDAGTGEAFAAAVRGLRENGTPYHLAHGLLDYAQFLAGAGDQPAAAEAIAEANDIARRLRCQPLLDRSASLLPSGTAAAASVRG